ncbi:MAG TPA: hypothetical protein VJ768_09345, partial [Anaerolineales bacterium]|nr:hypothetical protein [Anaerolineales bacterium]
LNFNYLPDLSDDIKSGATDRSPLWPLIRQSSIRTILENSGYLTVAFETGFYWTELDNANVYLSDSETSALQTGPIGGLNIFEAPFLKTTAALIISDATIKLPRAVSDALNYPTRLHRERVLYDLEMLERMPATLETPKFVFAHIVSPHEPFVFGPNGEDIRLEDSLSRDEFVTAYRDQVHYLNQRLLDVVSQLISTSQTPPVIILQGDHGVASFSDEVRMKIFNAYYLPDAENSQPYSTISPVNTFRIILNSYFGNDFDLLEDTSYFSTYDDPYNFNVISDLRSCG